MRHAQNVLLMRCAKERRNNGEEKEEAQTRQEKEFRKLIKFFLIFRIGHNTPSVLDTLTIYR